MEFDNKIFKKHYGKIYLDIIWIDVIVCVILILFYLLAYFIKNIDDRTMINLMFAIVIIVSISFIFILPFMIFSYLSALNKSKQQQQYYSKGCLIVELPSKTGLSLGLNDKGMCRYEISQISNISYTRRYMIIEGAIKLRNPNDAKDHGVSCKELKVPINFLDYDKILY